MDATPATLFLRPGTHRLKIQLEGAEPLEKTIEIDAGDVVDRTYHVPKPPDATIAVRSDEQGAAIRINGYPRGRTPLAPVVVRPGQVDVTAVSIDGRARAWRGRLGIAEQKTLEINFEAPEALTESSTKSLGQLTLGLSPEGEVFGGEDDRLIGKAPLLAHSLPAGEHHLVLRSKDGRLEKHVRIVVVANQLTVLRFSLTDADRVR